MIEFVKSNLADWTDGNLWYDERVPRWALVPVIATAVAVTIALFFTPGPAPRQMPSSGLLPLVVAAVGTSVAILLKWILLDSARTVPVITAASVWSAVAAIGIIPSSDNAVWPPFALLFMSPLLVPAVGRGWAMLAWHHRLERTLRDVRAVLRGLVEGKRQDGVLLLRVDALRNDDVALTAFDGETEIKAHAKSKLWSAVGAGRWYLTRGASLVKSSPERASRDDREAEDALRLASVASMDFVGVADPRDDRPESFWPEMVFWMVALVLLLVGAAAGARLLAGLAAH